MTTSSRVRVYIDGFNLYYGALRDSRTKWVNLEALAQRLMPDGDIERVFYFTARVSATPRDPGVATRQDTFFRAIRATCPRTEIVEGKYKIRKIVGERIPRPDCGCCQEVGCDCPCCTSETGMIRKPEEKGSDVNLAVAVVRDAYEDAYDIALIISDDSDLQGAVDVARQRGKQIVICDPRGRPRRSLQGDARRTLRAGAVAACQMPHPVISPEGRAIFMPPEWLPTQKDKEPDP